MWWKLCAIVIVTIVAIVAVIPIHTHAVLYDPEKPALSRGWSVSAMIGNMYFPMGTLVLIAAILLVAAWVSAWIIRSAQHR